MAQFEVSHRFYNLGRLIVEAKRGLAQGRCMSEPLAAVLMGSRARLFNTSAGFRQELGEDFAGFLRKRV